MKSNDDILRATLVDIAKIFAIAAFLACAGVAAFYGSKQKADNPGLAADVSRLDKDGCPREAPAACWSDGKDMHCTCGGFGSGLRNGR
jgi:hypothetical protein